MTRLWRWLTLFALCMMPGIAAAQTAEEEALLERLHALQALVFNPDRYFRIDDDNSRTILDVANAVDAIRYDGARGYRWAFAIQDDCDYRRCWYVLRAVELRDRDAAGNPLSFFAPNSEEAFWATVGSALSWREADLRRCPKAGQHMKSFSTIDARRKPANPTITMIVRADGSNVTVRAHLLAGSKSEESVVRRSDLEAGSSGAWAQEMMDIVEPCLKPSEAKAPWAR